MPAELSLREQRAVAEALAKESPPGYVERRKGQVTAVDLVNRLASVQYAYDDVETPYHRWLGPPPVVGQWVHVDVWGKRDRMIIGPAGTSPMVRWGKSADYDKVAVFGGPDTVNLTSGQTETSTTIGFGYTFGNATPTVFTEWYEPSTDNSYIKKIKARTATGFTVVVRKPDNTAFAATITQQIFWHAMGAAG